MTTTAYQETYSPVRLMDTGASDEEQARGAKAAYDVFDKNGVTSDQAYDAARARAEDLPHDAKHAEVWDAAESAAIEACCAGWFRIPESAVLWLDRPSTGDND